MGADATLVNMAYAASMANVPGNYAVSFNKQYEGLIASYKAQAEAIGGIATAVQKGVGKVSKSIAERQAIQRKNIFARTNLDSINDLVIQNAKNSAKEAGASRGGDGSILANNDIVNVATGEFQNIKNELTDVAQKQKDLTTMRGYEAELLDLSKKSFPGRKTKQREQELYRKVDVLKSNLINEKAATTAYINGVNNDSYNLSIGDQELTTLRAQVSNPNSNFKDQRIKAFRKNGKLMYEYDDGRLGAQHDANAAMLHAQLGTPFYGGTVAEKDKATRKVISHEELFGGMVLQAKETQAALELGIHNSGTNAEEVIKNPVTGGKAYKYESFTSGGAHSLYNQTYDSMVNGIYNSEQPADQIVLDMSNRTIKGRNYGEDIARGIAVTTFEELGYDKSEIMAADTNNDGYIGDNPSTEEIETGETFLDPTTMRKMRQILTAPVGEKQTKHAVSAMALYYTNLAEQEFNHVRGIMDNAVVATDKDKDEDKDKKTYFKFPWKTYETPVTSGEKLSQAFVQGVVNQNEQITLGENVFEKDIRRGKWTGKYKQTRGKAVTIDGERVEPLGGRPLTRTELIQRYGGIYSNIPNKHYDKEDKVTSATNQTQMMANFGQFEPEYIQGILPVKDAKEGAYYQNKQTGQKYRFMNGMYVEIYSPE